MSALNIIVVGAGMYVCGRGTGGHGTILPALLEWKKSNDLGEVYLVGTDPAGIKSSKDKASELFRDIGMDVSIRYFPKGAKIDRKAYLGAIHKIPRPACAIIAVPDTLHAEIASAAIEAGLHTLVVKPLAPTLREVKHLIRLQKINKVYCAVEFHKRFDHANLQLRDAIRSGSIGDPLYFCAEFSQRKSIPHKQFRKWVHTTNVFQYLGIHYVDIIYFSTGATPLRAMAVGQKGLLCSKGLNAYDSIQVLIEWELVNGKRFVSSILTNWIDPESTSAMSDQKIKVIGTKGRFESDQKSRGTKIITDEKGIEEPNPYFCCPYVERGGVSYRGYGIDSICQFLDDATKIENSILKISDLEGERPTFKDSIVPTMVLEAVNKSLANNGKWINI